MLTQTNYRQFLKDELTKRMRLNSRYSGRAFARDLKLSPGELNEILKGKRKLTLKKALKIAANLGLSEQETKDFVAMLTNHIAGKAFPHTQESTPSYDTLILQEDFFNIISDWYCFGILNLCECEDFRWDFSWIAKRLGIKQFQVEIAVERMVRVGLIEETENGYHASEDIVFNPGGIPSQAIRNYHDQIFDKAKEALITQSIDQREITGLGFAVDPQYISEIKKDIAEFRNNLVQKYNKGKKTEVYQLEFALFQLTQGETHE